MDRPDSSASIRSHLESIATLCRWLDPGFKPKLHWLSVRKQFDELDVPRAASSGDRRIIKPARYDVTPTPEQLDHIEQTRALLLPTFSHLGREKARDRLRRLYPRVSRRYCANDDCGLPIGDEAESCGVCGPGFGTITDRSIRLEASIDPAFPNQQPRPVEQSLLVLAIFADDADTERFGRNCPHLEAHLRGPRSTKVRGDPEPDAASGSGRSAPTRVVGQAKAADLTASRTRINIGRFRAW